MVSDLRQAIEFMEKFGFYDVVIPFLLVFTLVFGVLQKIKIFGKESKQYNALISVTIALLFVAASNLVEAVNQYMPVIGLVLAMFLGLMLMLGMFGVKEGSKGVQTLGWVLAGLVSITIGLAYLPQIKWFSDFFGSLENYSTLLLTIVIVMAVVIWLIKSDSTTSSE